MEKQWQNDLQSIYKLHSKEKEKAGLILIPDPVFFSGSGFEFLYRKLKLRKFYPF